MTHGVINWNDYYTYTDEAVVSSTDSSSTSPSVGQQGGVQFGPSIPNRSIQEIAEEERRLYLEERERQILQGSYSMVWQEDNPFEESKVVRRFKNAKEANEYYLSLL